MNQVAAITGGAQGIGRAAALLFAKQGYKVSIADVHKDAGFETIKMIRDAGGKAMFMVVDISKPDEVERWINLTAEDLGSLDVLINNAAIAANEPLLSLSYESFEQVIRVNLGGSFLCSQMAARIMQRQNRGNIINIASTRALMSEPDTEAYSASKGGILALTHAMAMSLGSYGVRVNTISPGWIETGDWKYSQTAIRAHHSERDLQQHPVGRVGRPEDIASACLFLASPQSSFMTGQNIVIDGGMTVKMIYE
jgi:NAD(P)-dependent dehydrogenase (short-subunit alcohol dehydrogenase family)